MGGISQIILASASPRRAEILKSAGFEFTVFASEVDESRKRREDAATYVKRVAEMKARAVQARLQNAPETFSSVIVAADTIVSVDGEILGKPVSPDDARSMLRRLSGRCHDVFSGLAVLEANTRDATLAVERTGVEFSALSDAEIDDYVQSGEPFGKAGAYAIQGRGGRFIPRVEGCYFNVMGLPLARLYTILRGFSSEKRVFVRGRKRTAL